MKTKCLSKLVSLFLLASAQIQNTNLDLTFNAVNDTSHVKLDSVKIKNLTQGVQNMIYWPDNAITLRSAREILFCISGILTYRPK